MVSQRSGSVTGDRRRDRVKKVRAQTQRSFFLIHVTVSGAGSSSLREAGTQAPSTLWLHDPWGHYLHLARVTHGLWTNHKHIAKVTLPELIEHFSPLVIQHGPGEWRGDGQESFNDETEKTQVWGYQPGELLGGPEFSGVAHNRVLRSHRGDWNFHSSRL